MPEPEYEWPRRPGATSMFRLGVVADGPRLRWRAQIGQAPFNSSPAIGPDGTIYIVAGLHPPRYLGEAGEPYVDQWYCESGLFAVSANGELRWLQHAAGFDIDPFFGADGRLYVRAGGFYGEGPGSRVLGYVLITVDPSTGDLKREIQAYAQECVPYPDANGICYTTDDHEQLFCVAPDGTYPWAVHNSGGVHYDMVGTDGRLYFTTYRSLCAYSLGGELLWRHAQVMNGRLTLARDGVLIVWESNGALSAYGQRGERLWSRTIGDRGTCRAIVAGDGTIYLCADGRRLMAVSEAGETRLVRELEHHATSGLRLGADGTLYLACSDHQVYAINRDGSVQWHFAVGDCVVSTPALGGDGSVYFGSNDGNLYALTTGGDLQWTLRSTVGRTMLASPVLGPGSKIYVTSADSRVHALNAYGKHYWTSPAYRFDPFAGLAVCPDGRTCAATLDRRIACFDEAGTLLWERALGAGFSTGPAAGDDGIIYLADLAGTVHAIEPSGDVRWSALACPGGHVTVPPLLGPEGNVYVHAWDRKLVIALNSAGSILWSMPAGCGRQQRSVMAIGLTGELLILSSDNQVRAISPDGTPLWSFTFEDEPHLHCGPTVAPDGTIYVCGWERLYAFDAKGKPKWSLASVRRGFHVNWLVVDAVGTVLAHSHETHLHAIANTGKQLWSWRYPHPTWQDAAPAIGPDGTIYIASRDGYLYALG